ncbi:protein-export chaperone SecB [Sphingomonas sp. AOB5]|uniref:protein-export chaperone SecB n=1 Tax=Sphingomonas sp. AOB5 TaxID=3034017 RepID=UPI0023F909A9|nr:protein-export chaperone SecB [Sphingomonas sp. AOB5]MDF7774672.1 protein-export chaperone SecB [Sphingomonas sp. AOB5]
MAEPEFGEPIANGEDTSPAVGILSQYVKDFSFENPNAPAIYQNQTGPGVDIQFNIGSGQVGEEVYEVALKVEARCTMGDTVAYLVDLTYAGLFGLRNIPADQIDPFLMSEAPRILFPFARRVLADAVRDGGFPPLLLEPIDFHGLYLARLEQQGQLGQEAGQA